MDTMKSPPTSGTQRAQHHVVPILIKVHPKLKRLINARSMEKGCNSVKAYIVELVLKDAKGTLAEQMIEGLKEGEN